MDDCVKDTGLYILVCAEGGNLVITRRQPDLDCT